MKETNYWKQFTMTGSVEDYLRYRSFTEERLSGSNKPDREEDGEGHAGMHGCDRDRVEDNPDWRIR